MTPELVAALLSPLASGLAAYLGVRIKLAQLEARADACDARAMAFAARTESAHARIDTLMGR